MVGSFVVKGDADTNKGFEGEVLAYDGGDAVVSIEVEQVEEGF